MLYLISANYTSLCHIDFLSPFESLGDVFREALVVSSIQIVCASFVVACLTSVSNFLEISFFTPDVNCEPLLEMMSDGGYACLIMPSMKHFPTVCAVIFCVGYAIRELGITSIVVMMCSYPTELCWLGNMFSAILSLGPIEGSAYLMRWLPSSDTNAKIWVIEVSSVFFYHLCNPWIISHCAL